MFKSYVKLPEANPHNQLVDDHNPDFPQSECDFVSGILAIITEPLPCKDPPKVMLTLIIAVDWSLRQ